MAVSIARKIAYDVLFRVESESAYASELLHWALTPDVKAADAALATELTLGVLRWRRLLDFLLDRQLKKPVEQLDLPVALALRLGLYQLRFLKNIPARAAVNESVELVKRARKSSAASLVNAVLRRAASEAKSPAEKFLPLNLALAERLAVLHSHPTWLVERWLARLGDPATVALLEANNQPPRLTFALNDATERDEVLADLKSSGLRISPGRLLINAFAASGGSLTRSEAFRKGQISIQDEASQAIPLLLGVRDGDRVLDLCAAPGGKTAPLARAAGLSGQVIAGELHEHRLRAMQTQLTRLGFSVARFSGEDIRKSKEDVGAAHHNSSRVRLVALDATQPLPFASAFARILVDAPCSGTGTLARHPEIRWRLRPAQLAEFHGLQTKLLRNALAQLAPGGRLVYSTCSMEPEENESVVAEALSSTERNREIEERTSLSEAGLRGALRLVPAAESAQFLAPHVTSSMAASGLFDEDGFFRTSPGVHSTDGFFAAVIEKTQ